MASIYKEFIVNASPQFANGFVVQDERRRLVYRIVGGDASHHNAFASGLRSPAAAQVSR